MVTSCRFHPNLQEALRLSKHKPITSDCIDAMRHVNIVAQYFDGKTLSNLTCLNKIHTHTPKLKRQVMKKSTPIARMSARGQGYYSFY